MTFFTLLPSHRTYPCCDLCGFPPFFLPSSSLRPPRRYYPIYYSEQTASVPQKQVDQIKNQLYGIIHIIGYMQWGGAALGGVALIGGGLTATCAPSLSISLSWLLPVGGVPSHAAPSVCAASPGRLSMAAVARRGGEPPQKNGGACMVHALGPY